MGRMMSQAMTVLGKDLRLEWRSRGRLISVLAFGVISLVLFSFAVGPDSTLMRAGASGFLILALLLTSTLGLSETFRIEREDGALESLLLLPIEPTAIFVGKAVGVWLMLLALAPALVPIALVLYSVDLEPASAVWMVALWALVSAGLAAPGSFYSAMTSRTRNRDVLLPFLLFPLVAPVVLSAVKAMALILGGDPMGQLRSWFIMLLCIDVIYWSVGGVLFSRILDEA